MKKKRNKRSRIRGKRSCGMGARNNYRGKGMQGGKGMAGTGKRAGQKLTWVWKYAPDYMGKRGFTSMKKLKAKSKVISLSQIQEHAEKMIKEGIGKRTPEGIEIELKGYKVLSNGILRDKFNIRASSFSKKVKEKIEKSGGKIEKIQ
ncbi:MAG: uL15 family ribosomal protein [Candidatus Pacearchaeota archaeon]|nr:uL15 family ribosomal protein [Candidatus Pacearchaeota archaeon]